MKNFKTEGVVIRRRNYKDQDRVLTIFTKTHGKIFVRGTGVRKITSRRAGHIELLNHGVFTLYQGNSYPILTEAITINNFAEIKNNMDKIPPSYHLCEIVDGLCPENQENMEVFELLVDTLDRLSDNQNNIEKIVADFEVSLLSLLGYWNKQQFAQAFDSEQFIENILERRLKSLRIFTKIN